MFESHKELGPHEEFGPHKRFGTQQAGLDTKIWAGRFGPKVFWDP